MNIGGGQQFYEVRVKETKEDRAGENLVYGVFLCLVGLVLLGVFVTWVEHQIYVLYTQAAAWVSETYAAFMAMLPF